MNEHNNSLGNCSTNGLALNTSNEYTNKSVSKSTRRFTSNVTHLTSRIGGLEAMRENLFHVQEHLEKGLTQGRRVPGTVRKELNKWIRLYENAVKASIGMPTLSESVTTQREASADIPTVPLDGFQLVRRTCYIPKLANEGTTAGGFYASLISSDLKDFVGTNNTYRIAKVTSWTTSRGDNSGNTSFAGVSVPATNGSSTSDSIMPIWSENRTPIGVGFAGIVTEYPLGDFPFYNGGAASPLLILTHFTSLGGTGGISGMPVVFHVVVDCLI